MIINQNLSALNTFNALAKNTKATQNSIQKLSTGQRINGAQDDAAGLAISEKMRGQISGLKQASSNAQDGISMLQTAEGGLDQTHSILQRMRALSVQSATDTNTADDRQKIQGEVDQLAKEITRISNTTEFNTQNLLAGGLSDTFHIGANAGQNLSVSVTAMDAQSLGVAGSNTTVANVTPGTTGLNVSSISRGIAASNGYQIVATRTEAAVKTSVTRASAGSASNTAANVLTNIALAATAASFTGTVDTDYRVKVASVSSAAATNGVNSISISKDGGTSWTNVTGDFNTGVKIDGMTWNIPTNNGGSYTVGDEYDFSMSAAKVNLQLENAAGIKMGASVDVHVGDTTASIGDALTNQTVGLQFAYGNLGGGVAGSTTLTFDAKHTDSTTASVSSGKVTSNATVVAGIDVSTQSSANNAITTIDKAINTVSQQRSQLGAYENRLTNTIDNLNTSNENITASESRIRDVDMAAEMSTYQKNNILQSAATSMLAKANQQPQSVLQLLQG